MLTPTEARERADQLRADQAKLFRESQTTIDANGAEINRLSQTNANIEAQTNAELRRLEGRILEIVELFGLDDEQSSDEKSEKPDPTVSDVIESQQRTGDEPV